MFSEKQLLNLYIKLDISLNGRKMVDSIRCSNPIRRVGGGANNVTTRFASRKMGCVIQAESHKGELPALYQWEYDPKTHEFYDQPSQVKLSYRTSNGRQSTHLSTPDFFLIQEDWMGWIECKPEEKLKESYESGNERFIPDGNGGWRCPPGERYASQFGLGFKVRSSKEINWIFTRNLEFLSDYLHADFLEPKEDIQAIIEGLFDSNRWILLIDLLECGELSSDEIYTLIAMNRLYFDIANELLSEPIYTNICQNSLSYQIYIRQKKAQCNTQKTDLSILELRPGSSLIWDGRPWSILNVGNSEIFLRDEKQTLATITFDQFQVLTKQQAISPIAKTESASAEILVDRLRKAAPTDLKQAIYRFEQLELASRSSSEISPRTLRYWRHLSREAEGACGNRFAGLVSQISARGNRQRKITPDVVRLMDEVIETEIMSALKPKITICYGMLQNKCLEIGLIPPSEKTFRAQIKQYKKESLVRARDGRKAAYSITEFHWVLDQSTPRHGERPFEIGHIDHTELDLELVDSRTRGNLGRPWLTILIDAFTRLILAFYLTFDPPSYRSCMSVIRLCVSRHGRMPKTIVVDKGKEFESFYFEALLARLETHKKSRPASKSRFGSVIERFFGINNQQLVHNLAGNNQALKNPRSMSKSHDPRELAIWTLPALMDRFAGFVDDIYASLEHPAFGISPEEAMVRGMAFFGARMHTQIIYNEDFIRLCMPSTPTGKATVRDGRGIKINGIQYWHPIFRETGVAGSKVPVVYDPFDISRAYAFVCGEWVLCRSEYLSIFERRTEREILLISQEIRGLLHLSGHRRKINVEKLAAFISRLRESETVLRQQRRDAEQGIQKIEVINSFPSIPVLSQPKRDSEIIWSENIAYEKFEELK